MILSYYKEEPNFGDSVNANIFPYFLPDFFDYDKESVFLGIGSVLGLMNGFNTTQKIIVFSSGFAYGKIPLVDEKYDIRCVRGPLTAKALKINPKLAITDGAVLLPLLPELKKTPSKRHKFSIIPHHQSQVMLGEKQEIFQELGINHINPKTDALEVIHQIRESEVVLTEAMHGAIIADCFRIPWIPIKMFGHINSFKWKDWSMSMGIRYQPERISSLLSKDWIYRILKQKFKGNKNKILAKSLAPAYKYYQAGFKEKKMIRELKSVMEKEPFLTKKATLESKTDQLLTALNNLRNDYSNKVYQKSGLR